MTVKCTSYRGFRYCFEVSGEDQGKHRKGLMALSWHQIWTIGIMLLLLAALFIFL